MKKQLMSNSSFRHSIGRAKPIVNKPLVKRQKGFTLIEIMVVVVIIALMGAIVGPAVFNNIEKAERTRIGRDIQSIENALKLYRLDNFNYPSQNEGLQALLTAPTSARNWQGPYLDDNGIPADPWNIEYRYAFPGVNGKDVEVFTYGADNVSGGEGSNADWGNWNIN